jgi:hypothetical protein
VYAASTPPVSGIASTFGYAPGASSCLAVRVLRADTDYPLRYLVREVALRMYAQLVTGNDRQYVSESLEDDKADLA